MMRIARAVLILAATAALVGSPTAGPGSATAAAPGARAKPHPIHSVVTLPESKGWTLRVNRATPNATALVRAANSLNKRPAAGRQFFLVNVTMRWTGKGSSTAFQAGQLNAIGRSSRPYTFKDTCGVVPSALDEYRKLKRGGSVSGNVCFSVRTGDARSLQLVYEPLFSATNRQVFFALR